MTKILKKSLACLLAFVLCFTAIASCLAVSAEAPALSSYFALYAQRPSSNDKAVGGVCEGELLRAQLDVTGLTAGTTMGIAITMPEGVVREDITVSGWSRNTACALNIVSDYLDEETNTFTMVVNVVAGGSYSFFVRFNVTENVPKNSVMKMNCTVEAATTSAAGDENIYTYNSKDAGHERPMEVKAHDEVVDAAVDATCEGTGLTEGSHCSRCEKTLVAQEEVAALGHAWDEGVVDPDATCTDEGVITYTCANDPSHTYTEAISAKGHTEVAYEEVAATCTTVGYTGGTYCSVCDAVITPRTEVPALGHDYGEPVDNGNGTHTATCANDANHTITEDHDFTNGDCVCGATKPAEGPQPDATLAGKLTSVTAQLSNSIGIYYRLNLYGVDMDDFEFVIRKPHIDGKTYDTVDDGNGDIVYDEKVYSKALGNYDSNSIVNYNYFYISYRDTAIYEMGNTITYTLYIIKDGVRTSYYTWQSTSLANILNAKYEETKADGTSPNADVAALAVSLLKLGTAAQDHFETLGTPDNILTTWGDHAANVDTSLAPDYGDVSRFIHSSADDTTITPSIQLLETPAVRFKFVNTSYRDPSKVISIKAEYTSKALDASETVRESNGSTLALDTVDEGKYATVGMYNFTFGKVALYDMTKVITFTVEMEDGAIFTEETTLMTVVAQNINLDNTAGVVYRALAQVNVAAANVWPEYQ